MCACQLERVYVLVYVRVYIRAGMHACACIRLCVCVRTIACILRAVKGVCGNTAYMS